MSTKEQAPKEEKKESSIWGTIKAIVQGCDKIVEDAVDVFLAAAKEEDS